MEFKLYRQNTTETEILKYENETKISLTRARQTNEWVLNTAGTTQEVSDFVKTKKLANHSHIMRKRELLRERDYMPGTRRRGRSRTAWINNINTWLKLTVEGSIRMTIVHRVDNPWIKDG